MNLRDMMALYRKEGLTQELASARVCQDIVLKAIAQGSLRNNVTIKFVVVSLHLHRAIGSVNNAPEIFIQLKHNSI